MDRKNETEMNAQFIPVSLFISRLPAQFVLAELMMSFFY